MKAREYCCCAIPIVNAGVYAALLEQIILGIVAGTLSVATPSSTFWQTEAYRFAAANRNLTPSVVVGAVTPGAAKWIFAIICYIGAGIQVAGFIAVSKVSKSSIHRHSAVCAGVKRPLPPQENHVLFRRYLALNWVITLGGFSISIAWIIASAARHSTAQANCQSDFYPAGSTGNNAASLANASDTVCNIFSWVDVGIMGGLWIVLLIMQVSAPDYIYLRGRSSDQITHPPSYTCSSWHRHTAKPKRLTESATTVSTNLPMPSPPISRWSPGPTLTTVTGKRTAISATGRPTNFTLNNLNMLTLMSRPRPRATLGTVTMTTG